MGPVHQRMTTIKQAFADKALVVFSAMARVTPIDKIRQVDPRLFQISVLSSLLLYGVTTSVFDIKAIEFIVILASALAAQWVGCALFAIRFEARSALITTLSLTLLLRSDALWPLALAAAIGVGSKFAFRFQEKHIFNPANAGIVALLLMSTYAYHGIAWTTPGQWGAALWFAALLASIGFFVTYSAKRLDVPLIFLGALAVMMIIRALWLGDPVSIPMHRLQNGALILFAFFMISDPKTTPDGRISRAVFAISAAALSYWFIYHQYTSDGFFYALAIICLLRPLIELFDRAPAYAWPTHQPRNAVTPPPAALTPAE